MCLDPLFTLALPSSTRSLNNERCLDHLSIASLLMKARVFSANISVSIQPTYADKVSLAQREREKKGKRTD